MAEQQRLEIDDTEPRYVLSPDMRERLGICLGIPVRADQVLNLDTQTVSGITGRMGGPSGGRTTSMPEGER